MDADTDFEALQNTSIMEDHGYEHGNTELIRRATLELFKWLDTLQKWFQEAMQKIQDIWIENGFIKGADESTLQTMQISMKLS